LRKTGKDMDMKKNICIAIVLLVILPATGFCFQVTAHVDKTRISREDSLLLRVVVQGGKADLDLSVITDFKVNSRGSSSSYNYINGKSERKATYNFVLIPLAKGSLKIPSIMATRDGEAAFTREIVVQVTEQEVNPDAVRSIFATAEVVKNNLFVGEQTLYSLKFYRSKRLSGLGFERPPEFNGFSVKPFEKEKGYTQSINGVLFQVTEVNYIIIPANPGTLTIDPAVLIAKVIVKTNRETGFDSFFNDSFFASSRSKPVRIKSNPVSIDVLPLPAYRGKGRFSGLVGQFGIIGKVDQTQLKTGDSATLTIKISGIGNIMDAGLPDINLKSGAFKVYDDNPVETIQLTEKGYEGFKIFKKAIVPVDPGDYVINPVELTYFDVDQKVYQTISTDAIQLKVIPSGDMHQAFLSVNPGQQKNSVKQEVSLVNKDILEIKEGLMVLENYKEISPLFFLVLLSLPGILFSGVKLFVRVSKRKVPVEKIMEEKAKYHLKQAGKTNRKDPAFLSHLYASLVALVLSKGKKRGESVTIDETRAVLTNAKVDDGQIDKIITLFETMESARFGGERMDQVTAETLFAKTRQVMKLLCCVLAFWGVFSVIPPETAANPTAALIDGIKQYKDGQFKQAALSFERVEKQEIKNPYLYYNIGNAYLKADDVGRAILWYERAKILSPNDPDLNFNLNHANSLVKDKREDTVNMMDVLFFWDNLVPVKVIQLTAVFFSFLFFAWAAIRVFKKQKVFSGTGILLCSIFILVTVIASVGCYKHTVQLNAVIVLSEVAVRSGVTDTSTKLFSLHAGSKVRVKEQRDGYLKISFSKDKVGWVKAGDALII